MIFLLVQNKQILGGAAMPTRVPFEKLDPAQSWEIVAGVENPRKIIGPICTFKALPGARYYRITSDLDGYHRLVGHAGTSVDLVFTRLETMMRNDVFSDHANLGKIEAFESND